MILITGADGQLGYSLQKILKKQNRPFAATDVGELNLLDFPTVEKYIADNEVSSIINCAAYNDVDKAESEPDLCFRLNAEVPAFLAKTARKYGCRYVTYSTDFVFDGKKGSPYTEEDEPCPLSVYSKAKRAGEIAVLDQNENALVVRTSWVFGVANRNFNKQVIGWAEKNAVLKIVDDQISSPTYSEDLALFSLDLLDRNASGLYHMSNDGEASKFDQAAYLLNRIGWKGELLRAKSSDFTLAAERPAYSKLNSEKLEAAVGKKIPSWQSGIDRYLEEMREQ